MKIAALLLALFIIAVSIMGIVATDTAMTLRRLYFATPGRFYAAGAIRVAMGLVLILAGSSSHWPRTLRALGVVMCLQAIAAHLFGLVRARDHGMGGDAGNRAPARRRRGGLSQQGFRSVSLCKDPVRGAQENSS